VNDGQTGQAATETKAAAAPRRKQRRTDGQDGPPRSVVAEPNNTPGAPNAALSEPATVYDQAYIARHPRAARLIVVDGDQCVLGTADGQPRRKKIAICGFASSTRPYIINSIAPDPEWEIWGLNQLYRHIPRADLWADIHYNWDKETVPGTDHYGWARDCGIPFVMLQRQPGLPTSCTYPLRRVLDAFRSDYFTSTIAYLVALAILEIDDRVKVELGNAVAKLTRADLRELGGAGLMALQRRIYDTYTIGLFGIDLTVGTEYFHEKPCAEFWIGQASARDIRVAIPPESALCKQRFRYGYERTPESLIRVADIVDHKTAIAKERDEQLKRLYMLEGALECDERWQQVAELRERGTRA
jgi:hypothetical protein